MSLESEIAQQPDVCARILDEGPREARTLAPRLAKASHLTFVARGTSDHAATYGKYLFESIAGIVSASAAPSIVTQYGAPPRYEGGAAIGISQSGSSPDVAAVVAAARRSGAFTIAITNAARSRLARTAEATFALRCGPERAVAATKTYTASCVVLALLASSTGAVSGASPIAFDGLVDAMREAVSSAREASRIARRIGRRRMLVVLGRGYDYAAALEGALKIKELARVWAEPYSSADFAHGPRTLLERDTPVLLFASRGVMLREARRTAGWLAERGAKVYAVTNDEGLAERCDDAVVIRTACSEAVAPIALSVVAQHLARAVAIRHGRDPERPVGISKVTRTL